MRKIISFFVCIAALSLANAAGWAQPGQDSRTVPGEGPAIRQDEQQGEADQLTVDDFVYLSALSTLLDIDVAQIASMKAASALVRAFVARVLADRRKTGGVDCGRKPDRRMDVLMLLARLAMLRWAWRLLHRR
jgi:hypothetical protein